MHEHFAFLPDAPQHVFDTVEDYALQNGFRVTSTEANLRVEAALGDITLKRAPGGAAITFGAETPSKLQLLKDLYAMRFAKMGVGDALEWRAVDATWPLNQMFGSVVSTTQISPNFMRVRLAGDFSAFLPEDAGLHFRLLFPAEGTDWPVLDDRGLTSWPGGAANWHRPSFTVRALGPDADWMDIDVVLHDGGRATEWVRGVQPGAEMALHGPSGSGLPDAAWFGLVGDETALPVIARMMEAAPAEAGGEAIILVRDPSDAQEIRTTSGIQVTWASMVADDPMEVIQSLNPPTEDIHVFFAGERSQATAAREVFKERGWTGRQAKAASYWTRG